MLKIIHFYVYLDMKEIFNDFDNGEWCNSLIAVLQSTKYVSAIFFSVAEFKKLDEDKVSGKKTVESANDNSKTDGGSSNKGNSENKQGNQPGVRHKNYI